MKQINIGVIGTGWCGGIRTETARRNPLVNEIHIAETNEIRLHEMAQLVGAKTATTNYQDLLKIDSIDAVIISATPETTHFPMARDALNAGKHVFLEKPIAIELEQADELIALAKKKNLKFTIGYSQRFNPKYAYVKKAINDGTIGKPVSILVSRHITRSLGKKIAGRVKLSPAAMESTHDLDFVFWCLEPAKPVKVYSQVNYGAMRESTGGDIPDTQWIMVTMDSGLSFVVGGGWSLPPGYPNFSSTWIEFVGSDGALMVDDSHKDVVLNTMKNGMQLPMSTMPGEQVDHIYAGPMAYETVHFIEAVAMDRDVLVTGEQARQVMEVYMAADLSAETGEPVYLPLPTEMLKAANG
ncbi:Gfo/Idh/MocA family protein [Polynucleobacter rarus]|jgi:scyllo-inositol 2-dehydrogenase (NAD+)|uniref:Gfo/Idh/MocA family protein n=1 Tax=Polynucleobacter rarus TaxID=556055 RepID=UPI000D3E641D|nr:Gfo/Idh/MocA family oxidoreductase [Polynucleobacter rarus]